MRIGDFEILATLGSGVSGVVYRATNTVTNRVVALKELRAESAEARERAIEEGRALASVASPHLVTIYYIHQIADRVYLESELLSGSNLATLIATQGLRADAAERLLRELLLGLQAMHGAGLIHGDLKPENVMLRTDGSAVIIDLGLASRGVATALGGTSQFMAPEMFKPPHRRDARSDLYSLGMTLYEAVVGRPAMGELFPEILAGRGAALDHHWQSWALDRSTMAVPVDRIRSDIPEHVSQLIADLMAKDPALRPASATAALSRIGLPGAAQPAAAPSRPSVLSRDRSIEIAPPSKKSGGSLRTAAFILLAIVLGAGAYVFYLYRTREVGIETIPPGATLVAGGKALGKVTPTTITVRGLGIHITVSRLGYKDARAEIPDSGPMETVRLEPVCADAKSPVDELKILVGEGFPTKPLEGLVSKYRFVGAGCEHDLALAGDSQHVSFKFQKRANISAEEWPLDRALPDSVAGRLSGLALAWELAMAWDSKAPVDEKSLEQDSRTDLASPQLHILWKEKSAPVGIPANSYSCCKAPAPAIEADKDQIAYSLSRPFPQPPDGSFLAVLEISPDGEVAMYANALSEHVSRVPPEKWEEVAPPRTPIQFVVALLFKNEPNFLPRFDPTDKEPTFRRLTTAEVDRLRDASRHNGRSWGRGYSVFEVK